MPGAQFPEYMRGRPFIRSGRLHSSLFFVAVASLLAPRVVLAQGAKSPEVILGTTSDAEIVETWSAMFREVAHNGDFSGVALLAKDGEPLYQEAFGFANQELAFTNSFDTRFNLGSASKMFTAVAVAQLVEQGKLAFDDPVVKHIPDYPNAYAAKRITLHHLLTHTSGLGFYPFQHGQDDIENVMNVFAGESLAFEPGSEFQYSNAGYLVLGVVIERVSGMRYLDYLNRYIFKPAGMSRSGDFVAKTEDPSVALPYRIDEETGRRVSAASMLEPFASPAGGVYSTVGDMLRFGEALRNHVLLGPAMTDTLMRGRIEMGRPGLRYGYGFGEHVVNGHRSVGHNGGAPGVAADFRMYLDDGYTTVLLSNFGGRHAVELARAVDALITDY